MASFENVLKSIIESAAKDFDETVDRDPTIPSVEDGTARGDYLDSILAQQKEQRAQLWKQLHELEDQYRERGLSTMYDASHEDKRLSILRHEEKELRIELNKQVESVEDIAQEEEPISELQFKEELDTNVNSLRDTLAFLQKELEDTQEALEREELSLQESSQITETLQKKLEKLEESTENMDPGRQKRDRFAALNDTYRGVIENLIDFLDEYYPPHAVDRVDNERLSDIRARNEKEEMCELKFIVEDLMNLLVVQPDNPYMELEPGTYWTPYIETLIKAGIAKRHPEEPRKLRLVDFREK
ncbi:hypothetical protein LRAMOSA01966 [Lichtheimia ramosa]|uniref:Centromere protein K n=1 Tax=Lichtheimia ramosa TaxID=688394 RepID=A0A077WMT7_9FUNG|nr:hypothetical protein LRAMOSA01966 [Lichtheimia ramosa]